MSLFDAITPVDILQRQVAVLRCQLPAVFDGDTKGVHDARIATRRLRAVFPLAQTVCPQMSRDDDLAERVKQLGRALGSIRDLDARLDLLTYVEARLPGAGFALVAARRRQQVKRASRMRKLVKRLEELDIERELEWLAHACGAVRWRRSSGPWRPHLRRVMQTHADEALAALAAATAVYFPKRTHTTRIAVKKLRYAAEIGAATGYPVDERAIRRLRKAQDALGDLHDRDVLLDELKDAGRTSDHRNGSSPQLETIVQFVEAEMTDQYRRFIERREPLVGAVRDVREAVQRSRAPAIAWTALLAGAAAAGLRALRRSSAADRAIAEMEPACAPSLVLQRRT